MVNRFEQQREETREKMRDGNGKVVMRYAAEGVQNCSLCAMITMGPGDSIGKHDHTTNTEIYYILDGEFLADDNGTMVTLHKGDTVVTGNGDFHSIKNATDKPATLLAVIVDA